MLGSIRTLELTLVVLQCPERSGARRLVAEEVEPEAMHNIDDLLAAIVKTLLGFLGRRICANVDVVAADGHFLAIHFVHRILLFNEVVCVRDDLVTSNDVLGIHLRQCPIPPAGFRDGLFALTL